MTKRPLGYLSQPVVLLGPRSRPRKLVNREIIDSFWYGREIKRKEQTRMARTASEGPANYARVVELVEQGSKLSEAFIQVAKEALPTGNEDEITKKSKSVAANYYRLKNKEEGHVPQKRGPGRPRKVDTETAPGESYNGQVLSVLSDAQQALQVAVQAAQEMQNELESLRQYKASIEALR